MRNIIFIPTLLFLLCAACQKSEPQPEVPQISVDREKLTISVKANSPFLKHLSVEKVVPSAATPLLKEKSSVIGVKTDSDWIFSNPDIGTLLTASLVGELREKNNVLVQSRISRDLAEQSKVGDQVFLAADNYSQARLQGQIILIKQINKSDIDDIYIAAATRSPIAMLDFYWVDFKYKFVKTYVIPTKAVLYISNEEYVLKKTGENIYAPKHISIASHTLKGVVGYGGLSDGDELLSEGAILLKPLVEDLVLPTYESQK